MNNNTSSLHTLSPSPIDHSNVDTRQKTREVAFSVMGAAFIVLIVFVLAKCHLQGQDEASRDRETKDREERKRNNIHERLSTSIWEEGVVSRDATKSNEKNCPICLLEFQKGTFLCHSAHPQCNHHFHAHCMESWLAKSGGGCPLCRRPFLADPSNDADETFTEITV